MLAHPEIREGMIAVDAALLTTVVLCLNISMLRDGGCAASGANGIVG